MKVEYIICFDDRTWETEVLDVPDDYAPQEYVERVLWGSLQYRKAVFIGVYNDNPCESEEAEEAYKCQHCGLLGGH